jgi:nucleotide-binding universal stress UspA family protein
MKTILMPTDFSEIAQNATDYAVQMAKRLNAKMVLFHAYHLPVITSEVPVVVPTLEEIEKDSMEALNELAKKIKQKEPSVTIDCVCQYGLAVDEISGYEKMHNVNMIVMGMHGAGVLSEKLIGSITTSVARKVKCPVLAVNKDVKYREIKKIVLACDYKEIQNESVLEPLKELVSAFGAHIYVVNVVREPVEIVPTTEQAVVGVKLEHSLETTGHSFHFAENEDVVEGINEFVDKENADMVAMIPRMHSALKDIFREPHIKQMAFHSHVPLLVLNE